MEVVVFRTPWEGCFDVSISMSTLKWGQPAQKGEGRG
jgi:hypothetical protein